MRKLMSKKGFTLVELMIVVVIMGILVAVAVPVYSAVTKNAEKKTCQSNQRIIKENLTNYQMTGGKDGTPLSIADLKKAVSSSNPTFLNMFDGGNLPTCPADPDKAYTIAIEGAEGATITYKVTCGTAEHNAATEQAKP